MIAPLQIIAIIALLISIVGASFVEYQRVSKNQSSEVVMFISNNETMIVAATIALQVLAAVLIVAGGLYGGKKPLYGGTKRRTR